MEQDEPADTFFVQYPLFFICEADDVALVQMQHPSADAIADGIPIFTDEDAALAFRDQHFAGWSMGAIPDEEFQMKSSSRDCSQD